MNLKDKISKNPKIKFYITIGTIPIILMFIGFFIVIQKMGRANFEYYADIINNQFNLFSMCVYIWVTDTFILPLSPMFVFPMLIQYPWYLVIPVTGLASALGGVSSYFIGRLLDKVNVINRAVLRAHEKWGAYIDKYGTTFVLVASIFPLPFSAVCMAAGVMKLNFFKVSLYSATRILRMAIYYFMFYLGLVAA